MEDREIVAKVVREYIPYSAFKNFSLEDLTSELLEALGRKDMMSEEEIEKIIDNQKINCVMCKCLLTGIQKERLAHALAGNIPKEGE